jgi:hypothetical protein
MPGYGHGWLLAQDRDGDSYEIINQARTAKYLANPALSLDNVSICDILAFGGCQTYAYGPEQVVASSGNLDFPGTASEWASVPSGAVAMVPSGDLCIVATVALDDWTPGGTSTIVGRYHTTGNQRAYALNITTTGAVQFQWSTDGTTPFTLTSSANLGATANGAKVTLAVAFQTVNGANSTARFYTASTPAGPWTILGTAVSTTAAAIKTNATSPIYFGSITAGISQIMAGRIYYVSIRNGIGAVQTVGGTEVFRFDADRDLVGYDATRGVDQTIVTSSGHPMRLDQFAVGAAGLVANPPSTRCDLVSQTYVNPSGDPAPWYNASYPESADALGFYIDEWTGLDDGHIKRNTTVLGGPGGGHQMGVVFAEGRTMALNIMLFARSEPAMEYLFRWLSSTLNSVCATCATSSVLIRRFCGTTADPWNGVAQLRQVGVAQGLKWESEIGTRARCYIRRASFTLMAGDPCMYLPETTAPTTAYDHTANLTAFYGTTNPPDNTRSICRPACSELPSGALTVRSFSATPMAAKAPVVTWTNNTTGYNIPFRAVVYFGDRDTTSPNPCGMPILGELYVRPLPPDSSMRWDVTGRTVEFRDASTGGWTPTWVYVDANDPPLRRFFAMPCGVGHVVLEPASMCLTYVSGTTYTLDGLTFNPPSYPTMTIALSERLSCP